jgi:hypothetical protein
MPAAGGAPRGCVQRACHTQRDAGMLCIELSCAATAPCSSPPWPWSPSPRTGSAPLVGHDLDHRPGAVSSRPCPQCPDRQTRCLPWTPHPVPHGLGVDARTAASPQLALPQRPTWCPHRPRGVHSDRYRGSTAGRLAQCPVSTAGPMACRADSTQPCAPPGPRATGRARRPAGRCLGGTSGAERGRPGRRAGPAPPCGPASSPGG